MLSDDCAGLRLPQAKVRDERLRIASEMLALTLRDAATMPVHQQQQVRQAVKALHEVRQWCKNHSSEKSAYG